MQKHSQHKHCVLLLIKTRTELSELLTGIAGKLILLLPCHKTLYPLNSMDRMLAHRITVMVVLLFAGHHAVKFRQKYLRHTGGVCHPDRPRIRRN